MNFELFIAKRIVFGSGEKKAISQPVVKIALSSIALGIAVMVVSLMVVTGFKKEITNKAVGFGTHIRISNFDSNSSYEEEPVNKNQPFYEEIKSDPDVKNIQVYATKAGIIKTKEEIHGILLKGIGPDFDRSFFRDKLKEGTFFTVTDSGKSDKVIISSKVAKLLNLKLNDHLFVYFIQKPPRIKKFSIAGIYETGLDEFDNIYVYCDIANIRQLNDWTDEQVGGFEVMLKDFDKLDKAGQKIYNETGFKFKTETIRELYPQIFNWLDLLNINVIIIIVLMILVAGINMISTLLIIILENTPMIGILKAMGAEDISIRKIFLYVSVYIIAIGLIIGNVFALGLSFLQWKFGWITLAQESYYISIVPVDFSFLKIAGLNIGTIILCSLMLIIPS
ncbi:MAG TPA: ABC transporter permease, partial [Bacteroidia bacterium]|nr:ABC transporter permease [Bacteroidia bacterium]